MKANKIVADFAAALSRLTAALGTRAEKILCAPDVFSTLNSVLN